MQYKTVQLIVMLALVIFIAPYAANAQASPKVYRIGWLRPGNPLVSSPNVEAFQQGLRDFGYVEGQNFVIENRWAEGQYARFPDLAAELVRLKVDVIAAVSAPAVLAAKNATQTIPIVMVGVGDAVRQGLVASLARPGGNVTGLTILTGPELWGKRLELLKEAVPSISRVGFLNDASNPFGGNRALRLDVLQTMSQAQGLTLQDLKVRERDELDSVLAAMSKEPDSALIVTAEALLLSHRSSITELVAQHRLPAMYELRDYADARGLMSYGPNYPDMFRRAAAYVDKVLKGTKPADLPVEQPMKFELVINLKTAKTLGITFPPALLMLADEVIK